MAREFTAEEWEHARLMYEEGASFAEIAGELRTQTRKVSLQCRDEGWQRKAEQREKAIRDATRGVEASAYREFVERSRDAIVADLAEHHQLNTRLRGVVRMEIERLESGGQREDEDVAKTAKDLAGTLKSLQETNYALANLKDVAWREAREESEIESGPDDDFMDLRDVN